VYKGERGNCVNYLWSTVHYPQKGNIPKKNQDIVISLLSLTNLIFMKQLHILVTPPKIILIQKQKHIIQCNFISFFKKDEVKTLEIKLNSQFLESQRQAYMDQ
jgi:hypothetical protein